MKYSINKSLLIDLIIYNQLIYFVFFVVDNVNFLWISLNLILTLSIILFNPRIPTKFSLLLICGILVLTNFLISSNSKITSIVFSFSLIISAVFQLGFIENNIKNFDLKKFIKKTVYLFFIFYFIQAFLHFFGIYELNLHGSSLENDSLLRYNSLMAEPSYSSTAMVALLFINQRINNSSKSLLIETLGSIFIFLCQSLFGILLFIFYIIIYHRKNFKILFYFEALIFLIVIIFFLSSEYFTRIITIVEFIYYNDFDVLEIVKVEPSGAFRIVPLIIYIENFELSLLSNYLFGYGSGSSESFLNYELFKIGYGTSEYDGSFQGGFLPSFLIDYGLIITGLFLYTIKTTFLLKNDIFQYLILLAILLNVNINTQLFWFPLFLFFTAKIYEKNIS